MFLEQIKKRLETLLGQAELAPKDNFLEVVKDLDVLLAKNKEELPKRLVHFLEKRSYGKALAFINEME